MNCVHAAVMSHFSLGIPSIQSPESPTIGAYFEQHLCLAPVKHTWQQVLHNSTPCLLEATVQLYTSPGSDLTHFDCPNDLLEKETRHSDPGADTTG